MARVYSCVHILIFALSFSACTKVENSPSVAAAPNIADSFVVKTDTLSANSNYQIAIARSALEKEFLLQGNVIPQTVSPTGNAIKSRIVAFRERGGKLYLLEATKGHVVTNDLPSNILLAEFPEISSDKNQIVFDFNAGMANLFTLTDMGSADETGVEYDGDAQFAASPLAKSFLESVSLSASNQLVIRQIAQLSSEGSLAPTEIRYYLSPYRPDDTYQPFPSNADFARYGYFQTDPQLTLNSDSVVYASRWNPKNKIVYALSANIPTAYRQAMKEGVLYWNAVFGQEIIQVIDAPAGATAPNPDYNIVQWVPYDSAGFAYADLQSDPRNGEIQHVQIYMTSVFAFATKADAFKILRTLRGRQSAKIKKAAQVRIRGFESASLCDFDGTADLIPTLETLIADDVDDATAAKAAMDYLRMVTAHEVGHTLGLRHNFAGSLAASYPLAGRSDLTAQYFAQKATPAGITISSSVMDYFVATEDFMLGDQLHHGAALTYDQKAIATLYSGAHYKDSEWPLFCTDSSVGKYLDCNRFDAGASSVEYNAWSEKSALEQMPNTLLELYIDNKTPISDNDTVPVEKVALPDPTATASKALAGRTALLKQFNNTGAILSVQRGFEVAAKFNSDVIRQAQMAYLSSEIQRLGGFAAVFPALPADYADQSMTRLDQLLKNVYRQGTASGDKSFSFNDDEVKVIEANARIYFDKFAKEYRKQELKTLAGDGITDKFVEDPLLNQLATYLESRAQGAVLAATGDYIVADVDLPNSDGTPGTTKKNVSLPVFANSTEIRLLATTLLNGDRSNDVDWAYIERSKLADSFADIFKAVFGDDITLSDLKAAKLPPQVARWVFENAKIAEAMKSSD